MVLVTGAVTVDMGQLAEALAISLEHVRRSRAEPGCVSHAVHQDAEEPCRLFFFERWADRAALEAHFRVPESRFFVAALGRLATSPPEMAIYEAEPAS